MVSTMTVAEFDLDLEVFQGPFDLLLALVLREEIELAELPIAEIVVAYVELLEERDEIDLESATEFVVLIAALLEIKVRMLFGLEDDEEEELTVEEAEQELIERLIEYRRYAASARWLGRPGRGHAPPVPLGAGAAAAAARTGDRGVQRGSLAAARRDGDASDLAAGDRHLRGAAQAGAGQ